MEVVFLLHTQSFPYFSLEDDNLVLWIPGVQEPQFYPDSIYLHLANAYTHHYYDTDSFFSYAFDLLTSWSWQEFIARIAILDSRYHAAILSTQTEKG